MLYRLLIIIIQAQPCRQFHVNVKPLLDAARQTLMTTKKIDTTLVSAGRSKRYTQGAVNCIRAARPPFQTLSWHLSKPVIMY